MLAALAIKLPQEGKGAVYLSDCRQLARCPAKYLKDALVLTYSGDPEAQSGFLQYTTAQALVRWCIDQAAVVGEKLYFLINEIGALDTDPESLDSVSVEDRQQSARLNAGLGARHYLVYSSGRNYKHGLRERDGSSALRKPFFGGMSEVQLIS